MEAIEKSNGIFLQLSKNEALVLQDWLGRFNEKEKTNVVVDEAEQRILWDMEAAFEKLLSEPFEPNYTELVKNAKECIRD